MNFAALFDMKGSSAHVPDYRKSNHDFEVPVTICQLGDLRYLLGEGIECIAGQCIVFLWLFALGCVKFW
jgi:hypothetical protein